MLGERALPDTTRLRLPPDLLSELQRRGPAPKDDMRVEGWKPSLLSRVLAFLTGKRVA